MALPLAEAGDPGSSEEALVLQAQARSPEAWALIYERHFGRIYSYVFYRLRDRELAEDLASQVFVEALVGIARYRYTGRPLLAWLYRIAHNITVDHVRRATRDPSRHQLPEEIHGGDSTEPLAQRADIANALARLRPEQQQVVILRFMEGLTSNEVAQVMSKSEAAVKALQVRALQTLRRELGVDIERLRLQRSEAT
jgi:RNA polymerase sigma-70 factor (ECF subfamily)